jgi:prevent-host-death family protein
MYKKVAISKFKAHCLEIIKNLQSDHQPVIITKRDKPIARVMPLETEIVSLFGMFKSKGKINGDIISPIEEKWDAQA